jgi:hypothetical protein
MSTVILRAKRSSPLLDETVHRNVVAAANALAERTGVALIGIDAAGDRLVLDVEGPQLVAIGFAAELRRITNTWHRGRFDGAPLWDEPTAGDGFLDLPGW